MSNTIYTHNYTYLLEYSNGMLYHGVRSCNSSIEEDAYYGSSKHTPKNEIPQKTILTQHKTRVDAVSEEIRYHAEYNVKSNDLYYNRSNQTSTRFDMSGTTASEDTKRKMVLSWEGRDRALWNAGRILSEDTKKKISDTLMGRFKGKNNPMFGMTEDKSPHYGKRHTVETKDKMSVAAKNLTKKSCPH